MPSSLSDRCARIGRRARVHANSAIIRTCNLRWVATCYVYKHTLGGSCFKAGRIEAVVQSTQPENKEGRSAAEVLASPKPFHINQPPTPCIPVQRPPEPQACVVYELMVCFQKRCWASAWCRAAPHRDFRFNFSSFNDLLPPSFLPSAHSRPPRSQPSLTSSLKI
ncbi:hypothetical protein L209DRAFT_759138 [Thermothelomyces heterothallicus CBS 203.75]